MAAPMMPVVEKGNDTGEARLRWYADAPDCPECGEHRVSVGQARIGFFGLSLTYFDRCDSCLPPEVAAYSRQVRANLLGDAGGPDEPSTEDRVNGKLRQTAAAIRGLRS